MSGDLTKGDCIHCVWGRYGVHEQGNSRDVEDLGRMRCFGR